MVKLSHPYTEDAFQPIKNLECITEDKDFYHGRLIFVCQGGEKLGWNGLPYLAHMTKLFKVMLDDFQCFAI